MTKGKRVVTNVIVSTVTQIITLVLGLVLPRVILTSWGSEYNGLINSVTTVMRYLALLEAGISTSTLQALYKSIGQGDARQTAVVIKSSQTYYHKVAFIYGLMVVGVSFVYPLALDTKIPYWEIFFVILLQGCTGVINFAFRTAYQQILNAEGKYYIISFVTLLTTVLTYAAKLVSIMVFNNIIVMQVFGVVIMGLQVLIYAVYFHKNYNWLDMTVDVNMSLLENRKYYVVQQIGTLVFNSMDTFLLSVFCGLKVASVYTVYNMIYSALGTLIGILRGSTNFVLGQSFHESRKKFSGVYKVYSALQVTLGSLLASCSVVLILGFVSLYTRGITDINYINYFAAIQFSLNIILDCARGANLAGANVAGQAPKTTWRYLAEAFINLVVSLALVHNLQMNGVLAGTVAAGIWRSIDSIFYFYRNVLLESPIHELLYDAANLALFTVFAVSGAMFPLTINSYFRFCCYGIVTCAVASVMYGGLFYLLYQNEVKILIRRIVRKR